MRTWRGCRSGGAPDQKVARLTEQTPPDQIEAPDQLGSEASRFKLELQPNTPLDIYQPQEGKTGAIISYSQKISFAAEPYMSASSAAVIAASSTLKPVIGIYSWDLGPALRNQYDAD